MSVSQFDNISAKSQISDQYPSLKEKISRQWYTDPPQKYSGDILHNNIHGNGFYFIQREDSKLFYDGLFYANKLEGYSQIFYGDGSHFQGLFKDNRRLGPGVLTYANGEQDVGLWKEFSMTRLESVVEPNIVPRLGKSATGKAKLVRYRYLVPVCPDDEDVAQEVLRGLGANEKILNDSYKLYNLEVEDRCNLFFNKKLYDQHFYSTQDCIIDILIPEEEEKEEETPKVEKVAEEEEECCKTSETDLGRIRQISDELELIEYKLEAIRRAKNILSEKVLYCTMCCYDMPDEENLSIEQSDLLKEGELDAATASETHHTQEDNVSYITIDYEKDIFHLTSVVETLPETERMDEETKIVGDVSIEDYLNDYCDCDEEMQIDDLDKLEKQLEAVKKDETFYQTIKDNLQEKLKMHLKKSEVSNAKVRTKQVIVNDLLAWNNEELSMFMLKHSFLHRKSEYMVNFNVSNLLKGKRGEFSSPGLHERNCTEFLINCSRGATKQLLENTRRHNINVNLCDARGNTGIFYAAANGRVDTIPMLINFGAKLDQVNDEGLTPLAVCLLIYLAIKNDTFDWEASFLPTSNPPLVIQEDLPKWYPDKSLLSVNNDSLSGKRSTEELTIQASASENRLLRTCPKQPKTQGDVKESYAFDTSFKVYKEPPKKKAGKAKGKEKASKTPVEETPSQIQLRQLKEDNQRLIQQTVEVLLESGVNPNVGEVPLPPLLLAVFTENEDLVRGILTSKADINIAMQDQLTALHIVASLRCVEENILICRTLLAYEGDVNLKTSTGHWREQKATILGKNMKPDEYEDNGKNPLHILCLRRDFPTDACQYFQNLATMLIDQKINVNDRYLGHTPLSLAVLSGNLNLVEALLKMKPVPIDPHALLDYNMGNVLTLYILKRYDNILPLETCQQMLKLLIDLGANLLRPIGDFENAIGFMEKEHEVIKPEKGKKGKDKSKKGSKKSKKESKKSSSKGSKKGKKGKVPAQEVLKDYLKELARDTIIKYIQLEAVENLYTLAEANMLEYGFTKVLAEFLKPPLALELLAVIFNHGIIKTARFDKNICLQVLEFVEKYQKIVKVKKEKKGKKGKKDKKEKGKKGKKGKSKSSSSKSSSVVEPPPKPEPTLSDLIDATNFDRLRKDRSRIKLVKPGLDDTTKYNVCFHCLRRFDKVLLLCPRCQYVYFCSEQCNKLNVKLKAQHNCTANFYKAEKQRVDLGNVLYPENVHQLCRLARVECEENFRRKQEAELELQRAQLEQEARLDIYGTRFIKKRRQKLVERRSIAESSHSSEATSADRPSVSATERRIIDLTFLALDERLTRLSDVEEKYLIMMNKRHESSVRGLEKSEKKKRKTHVKGKLDKRKDTCRCKQTHLPDQEGDKFKQKSALAKTAGDGFMSKFETAEVMPEPENIVRKLRRIPSKYQYFIELLSNYFPDVDLSRLFLPYACYSNGHLYYNFLNENIFSRTYSVM